MMDIEQLRYQIEQVDSLPTIPAVMRKILNIIENPYVSLTKIGNFISNDPVLTTRVLKMVNSPIYGFPGRIYSVNQALILLGLNVVKGMLFGVSVFEAMQKTMLGLWEHSVGSAITARVIANKIDFKDVEEVSVGALLHDIGKVILSLKFPDVYKKVLLEAEKNLVWIGDIEKKYFGINHSQAAAWVTEKWHFPKALTDMIENHHKPYSSKYANIQTAIIHLSDIIVRARGIGFAGDNFVPVLNNDAWSILRLNEEVLKDIYSEIDIALEDSEEFAISE